VVNCEVPAIEEQMAIIRVNTATTHAGHTTGNDDKAPVKAPIINAQFRNFLKKLGVSLFNRLPINLIDFISLI